MLMVGINFIRSLLYHHIQPYYHKNKLRESAEPHLLETERYLTQLYKNINGKHIAKQASLAKEEYIYGEIEILSFADLLAVCNPKKGATFYDLGSGTGKAVIAASLLHDWQLCCGIELVEALHATALQCLQRIDTIKHAPIHFINNSFFDIDLGKANVVFINASAFWDDFYERLVNMLCQLPSGTHVIITSHRLPTSHFNEIYWEKTLMSWGMVYTGVYAKN